LAAALERLRQRAWVREHSAAKLRANEFLTGM
jgi:hypothetical protein